MLPHQYFWMEYGANGFAPPPYFQVWNAQQLNIPYQSSYDPASFMGNIPDRKSEEQLDANHTNPGQYLQFPVEAAPSATELAFPHEFEKPIRTVQKSQKPHPMVSRRKRRNPSSKSVKYPNTNTESNICNQALGFLIHKEKSESVLLRLLNLGNRSNTGKLCYLYYTYTGVLKRHQRSYLNRKFIFQLSTEVECDAMKEVRSSVVYSEELPMEEFVRITRILLKHFIDVFCPVAILNSKQMPSDSRRNNLSRRHAIKAYLLERFMSKAYNW